MARKPILTLDVDGVLLDFMTAFDKAAEIYFKKPIKIHYDELSMEHYHLGKRIQASEKDIQNIMQYMIDSEMYAHLNPLPGVKEALQAIQEMDFSVQLATAIPDSAKYLRLKNLKQALDFVPDEIYCVGMGESKKEIIKYINPDIYIDDRLEYLSSAPHVYHLVWCDQKESQIEKGFQVDVHVHSLKEWTDHHMHKVMNDLKEHYEKKKPLQMSLKLESHKRKYGV